MVRDFTQNTATTPFNNVCTFLRHQKATIDSIDYVFAMCNVQRWENTDYKDAPILIKMRHDSGRVIFMKHLPNDPFNNNML